MSKFSPEETRKLMNTFKKFLAEGVVPDYGQRRGPGGQESDPDWSQTSGGYIKLENLINFINNCTKQGWNDTRIIEQIKLVATGYRGPNLHDNAIELIDGIK